MKLLRESALSARTWTVRTGSTRKRISPHYGVCTSNKTQPERPQKQLNV
jgi:hypothetical protein